MKDLFERSYNPDEKEAGISKRPLGVVSDFAVEQLPVELDAIRAGSQHANRLTNFVGVLVENLPYERIDEVMKDPDMLEASRGGLRYFP